MKSIYVIEVTSKQNLAKSISSVGYKDFNEAIAFIKGRSDYRKCITAWSYEGKSNFYNIKEITLA